MGFMISILHSYCNLFDCSSDGGMVQWLKEGCISITSFSHDVPYLVLSSIWLETVVYLEFQNQHTVG